MGKHAVFAAIGLLVGLGLGLVIGNGLWGDAPTQVAQTPIIDDRTQSPTANDNALRSELGDTHKHDTQPSPTKPGEHTDDARPMPTLAEIIAKADIPPIPSGNGTITGHVLTDTGEPVPGVSVTATPDYPGDRGWDGKTIEERISARIRSERWVEAARRESVSAADGSYSLPDLDPQAVYYIGAKADGWTFQQREGTRNLRNKAGDVVDFVAEITIAVEVLVFLPDGRPAPTGLVSHGPPGNRNGGGYGVYQGKATIYAKPGKWEFRASGGGKEELRSDPQVLELQAGVKPEPLSLHLKPVPGIIGTVKSELGTSDRVQSRVYLQTSPPAEAPDGTFRNDRNMASDWPHSGTFSFLELAPGTYRVMLVVDQKVCDWEDVVVTDGTVEVTLNVPAPQREDYIIVRVYAPDGKLCNDIDFSLTWRSNNGSSGGGARIAQQSDGSYWVFKRNQSSKSESGNETTSEAWWVITVQSKRWGNKDVRYELADTHELEVRFVEPANVTLTVSNFNEHSLRDSLQWSLMAADKSDTSRGWYPRYGREEQAYASPFQLGPVEPGAYILVLSLTTEHRTRELQREPVTLVAGENAISSLVPELYDLKVQCRNLQEAQRVHLSRDGRRIQAWDITKIVEETVATFKTLIAGEYELASSDGRMTITVPAAGVVQFNPPKYDCIVLSAIKSGGIVEGLGLRNGDKLIEVDGASIGDEATFDAHIKLSLARESTTWKVLRGGIATDVTFSGKALSEALTKKKETREDLDFDPGYQSE